MNFLDRVCGKPNYPIKQFGDYRNYPYHLMVRATPKPASKPSAKSPLPVIRPFRLVFQGS